jgi:clan AA aspartic protease
MELEHANIVLSNPVKAELRPIEARCLLNKEATYLCIPKHIAAQLQIDILETREIALADGGGRSVPYAGPIKVTFDNRSCFAGTLVVGNEVVLGVIPLEDLGLMH